MLDTDVFYCFWIFVSVNAVQTQRDNSRASFKRRSPRPTCEHHRHAMQSAPRTQHCTTIMIIRSGDIMQSAPCTQHCTTSTLSHHVNPMFVLALPLTEPPALPWTWESRTIYDRHNLQLRQAHRTSSRVATLERGTVVGGAPLTGDPPSGRRHQRDFAPDVEYHMQAAAPAV